MASQGEGLVSLKSEIERTSAMTRGSNSGAQKMTGISIDSPKLDSLEAEATAILQQNWQGGWEVGSSRGGGIEKTLELTRVKTNCT